MQSAFAKASADKGVKIIIPTKAYICQYIYSNYGNRPLLSRNDPFGSKVMDLLERPLHQQDLDAVADYPVSMEIYLPIRVLDHHGFEMTKTGTRFFNSFVECLVKKELIFYLNIMTSMMQQKQAIQFYMDHFNFSEETFSSETIKKIYDRYRKKEGLPYIRKFKERKRDHLEVIPLAPFANTQSLHKGGTASPQPPFANTQNLRKGGMLRAATNSEFIYDRNVLSNFQTKKIAHAGF